MSNVRARTENCKANSSGRLPSEDESVLGESQNSDPFFPSRSSVAIGKNYKTNKFYFCDLLIKIL